MSRFIYTVSTKSLSFPVNEVRVVRFVKLTGSSILSSEGMGKTFGLELVRNHICLSEVQTRVTSVSR